MKISIDTETEEISELKSAIAIIEEAVKRRENPDNEEETVEETPKQESFPEQPSFEEETVEEQAPSQPEPSVDISALSTSDYGQEIENRNLDNFSKTEQDNKAIVKEIILTLSKQNPNQPIQMSDITSKCSEKNIQDEEARKLIDELKDSGEI